MYSLSPPPSVHAFPQLRGAPLMRSSFEGIDLSYARLDNADLREVSFRRSLCIGSSFNSAKMQSSDFQRCYDLTEATFKLADLREATFFRAMGIR